MRLLELLEGISSQGAADCEVSGITDDSRKVGKGTIFVCVRGQKYDGHRFAAEALEKGAAAVVTEEDLRLPRQIIVPDTRECYGNLCAAWFGHPERKMKLIGVTGTNGKTTITKLIQNILSAGGEKVGLIGTIQTEIAGEILEAANTTPFAYDFFELLSKMAEKGCAYAVMEVSSFALSQCRTGPAHFVTAVFTNLTQDHLDYHKNMEEYYQAKKLLFSRCDTALINVDDEYGKRLYEEATCEKYSSSIHGPADFTASGWTVSPEGTPVTLEGRLKGRTQIRLPGEFNVSNALQAAAACVLAGVPGEEVLSRLPGCGAVKGRCEVIPTGREFTVLCDYAHTPDALENILSSVKSYTKGRLICLFGCGGNRDAAKRPKMARAAARYADYLLVTSDNPRDEEPMSIIQEITAGLEACAVPHETICDRVEAIHRGIQMAQAGDVLLLAGKGHEDYQILKDGRHIHLDEREVVAEALKELPDSI